MAKPMIEPDSLFTFNGRRYDIQSFADTFLDGNIEEAMYTAQELVVSGRAKIEIHMSKEQKLFEKTADERQWKNEADQHDAFVEQHKDFNAQKKREGRATYPEVKVPYPHLLKAQEQQKQFHEALRLRPEQSEIKMTFEGVSISFYDITDSEMNYISRVYNADKAITNVLGGLEKGTNALTEGTGYAATKIVAPVAQIGTKATVSLLRTIAKTAIKIGGSAVTATSQGIKQTAYEVRHDPDVLRAGRELLEVKDAGMRTIGKGGSKAGGGIQIIR